MNVLTEILNWSTDRPKWQRDALRRLVINRDLSEDDLNELLEICKSEHGLSKSTSFDPLEKKHIPNEDKDSELVNLESIYHRRGVNALAEDQEVKFGPNLTIVYGDNGAGKSGYTRIVKSACRARGTEDILGNVLSGSTTPNPSFSLKYTKGDSGPVLEWVGKTEDESIGKISVFDSHSAAVYLNEKTDVAFRPFGLDLFDNLARACHSIRTLLNNDKAKIDHSLIENLNLPNPTQASELVKNLSSLTDPKEIESLSKLSDDEVSRKKHIENELKDIRANDPTEKAKELKLRSSRLNTFSQYLLSTKNIIDRENINKIFASLVDYKQKEETSIKIRESIFSPELLEGTGTSQWRAMWESARSFSNSSAYEGKNFPYTDAGSKCVLCQQDYSNETVSRMEHFESYIQSKAELETNEAKQLYSNLKSDFVNLKLDLETTPQHIEEIKIEDKKLSIELEECFAILKTRYLKVIQALDKSDDRAPNLERTIIPVGKVSALAEQLNQRANSLLEGKSEENVNKLESELKELDAREALNKNYDLILQEINRKKEIAAFRGCIDDTNTQGITTKSTAVTKAAVTKKLKQSFDAELIKLQFKHVNVELNEVGGQVGNLYHKLVLTRAPGVELPKVVSEGEARCLSIAAFFAELSTANYPSTIIFDDPVSSLDFQWRNNVAKRLVEEAMQRQVIIFTHDIVFLLTLHRLAGENNVQKLDQHVRQLSVGAGVCKQELPWVALSVKKRIGVLKNDLQIADKLYRNGHQNEYEKDASLIYGHLREAWERGLEEKLLCGLVERYRPSVQTQQIKAIADIEMTDCITLENAMTKCSKWLIGHDQAPGACEEIPKPDELKEDIETLEQWIKSIDKRRK